MGDVRPPPPGGGAPSAAGAEGPAPAGPSGRAPGPQPAALLYQHMHDAVRRELRQLAALVAELDEGLGHAADPAGIRAKLRRLKEKYAFLGSIYRFHTSVEDDIVYPALEAKVKNVTGGYSHEHEDEGRRLEQLLELIDGAITCKGGVPELALRVRQLVNRVTEIHLLLARHMTKEEAHLYPLLLRHFSPAEQAALVIEYFCSIPLNDVEPVLRWLVEDIDRGELAAMQEAVTAACAHQGVSKIIEAWMEPWQGAPRATGAVEGAGAGGGAAPLDAAAAPGPAAAAYSRDPILVVKDFHDAIRSEIRTIARGVEELARARAEALRSDAVQGLLDRLRFLRSVCIYHASQEDSVLFPEAVKRAEGAAPECMTEAHDDNTSAFETSADILAEIHVLLRRNVSRPELDAKLAELQAELRELEHEMLHHMEEEEGAFLPMVISNFSAEEQCGLVWSSFRSLPLRLLRRVLPWIRETLPEAGRREMAAVLQNGAPKRDKDLVKLLVDLDARGEKRPLPPGQDAGGGAGPPSEPAAKQARGLDEGQPKGNPIDHIFQFHRALTVELQLFNTDAREFGQAIDAALQKRQSSSSSEEGPQDSGNSSATTDTEALSGLVDNLSAKFAFLKGIYHAHSTAEDDIVFPALEAKEALSNVCQSYTLDHEHEENLFLGLAEVLGEVDRTVKSLQPDGGERRLGQVLAAAKVLANKLQAMVSAVAASLEAHVKSEEQTLWPLFSEHFDHAEQEAIVGTIIGKTGAEVLQTMLPWVLKSLQKHEGEDMLSALESTTRNTNFGSWLKKHKIGVGAEDPACKVCHGAGPAPLPALSGPPARGTSMTADRTEFKPGWEDIFRMTQYGLEAEVRKISQEPDIDPARKAYLVQHLMASKWIRSQQQRTAKGLQASGAGAPADGKGHFRSVRGDGALGCAHYKANCALRFSGSSQYHVCRLCHDAESERAADNLKVDRMVCMLCGMEQGVSNECTKCKSQMARYFCKECNLFDNEPGRDIFHCPFCNICRRGKGLGIDFFHCMKCNQCLSIELEATHKCREKALEDQCPICMEDMFTSTNSVKALPCGHYMHTSCFKEHSKHSFTCPTCSKSMGDMSVYFQMLESLVAAEADFMPEEDKRRTSRIICNDCGDHSTVPFHYVYHQCPGCKSFNTKLSAHA